MKDGLGSVRGESVADGKEQLTGTCPEGFCRKTIQLERELARWKREEAVLRDIERRYLALADNPLLILLILSEGKVLFMNRQGEEFFGFPLRERPRFLLTEYAAPGYAVQLEEMLAPEGAGGLRSGRLLFAVRSEDGEEKRLDLSVVPGSYMGVPVLLGAGYELPETPSPQAAGEAICDPVRLLLSEREDVALCSMNAECVPSFMTEGFKNAWIRLRMRLPEEGESLLDLLPEDDRGEPFRLAVERARAGEQAEIGQESADAFFKLSFSPIYNREGESLGISLILTDRTEHRTLERERRADADRFRRIFSASGEMMLISTIDEGRILRCNKSFLSRMGYSESDVSGRSEEELQLFRGIGQRSRLLKEIEEKGVVEDFELRMNTASGDPFFGRASAERMEMDGRACLLIVVRDVTEEKRTEERKRAATDVLSGIPNREGFERILRTETERAMRYRGNISLILIDVDGFGALNEQLGREAGDKVLKDFCSAIKGRIRPTDFIGRWGGDEFAILTPMSGPLAFQTAEGIRDMVFHFKFLPDRTLSSSVGVAEFRREMEMEEFVRRAENALADAKKAGGNKSILSPFLR